MASMSDKIDELLNEVCMDYALLYPTDLKDAIIGIVDRIGQDTVLLLDKDKCIDIFIERDDMTYEEAIEHFEYNVIGSYIEGVPAFATLIK